MQIQIEQEEVSPFEIIYNARSSRATRSRKSSISVLDKQKIRAKTKKLRKMTLNPQSIRYEEIREIEQIHEKAAVRSQKGEGGEGVAQEFDFAKFLELGSGNVQSEVEMQLENGIGFGIRSERELDSDLDWAWGKQATGVELMDMQEE